MVSEDSALDVSLALIGGERFRAAEAERERYLKRVGAGIAVVLVHVLILAALLTRIVDVTATHPPKEIVFILPPLCAWVWLRQKLEAPGTLFFVPSATFLENIVAGVAGPWIATQTSDENGGEADSKSQPSQTDGSLKIGSLKKEERHE